MAIKETVKGKSGRPKKPSFPIPSYVNDLTEGEQEIYWQFTQSILSENPDLSVADRFHLHLAAIEYVLLMRAYGNILLNDRAPSGKETSHFGNLYRALEFCSVGRKDRLKAQGSNPGMDDDLKELAGIK